MTGTSWITLARPLSTITLVTHPRGENHEFANSNPNHELATTCMADLNVQGNRNMQVSTVVLFRVTYMYEVIKLNYI